MKCDHWTYVYIFIELIFILHLKNTFLVPNAVLQSIPRGTSTPTRESLTSSRVKFSSSAGALLFLCLCVNNRFHYKDWRHFFLSSFLSFSVNEKEVGAASRFYWRNRDARHTEWCVHISSDTVKLKMWPYVTTTLRHDGRLLLHLLYWSTGKLSSIHRWKPQNHIWFTWTFWSPSQ